MSKLEPARTCSNPTATEVLRRLLDERGVEWDYGITGSTTTRFIVNGIDLTFTPMRDGLVCSTILTPEQAIAATLGAGTCKLTMDGTDGCFGCSECLENIPPLANYCPNCGRRCVG